MRQLLEYTAFNLSKISKHEDKINVLENNEIVDIILISTNNKVIISNPMELTERLIGKKETKDFIKISFNKNIIQKTKEKDYKGLKIKMKKYTHYSLIESMYQKLQQNKKSFLNELSQQNKILEQIENLKKDLEYKTKLSQEKEILSKKLKEIKQLNRKYGLNN